MTHPSSFKSQAIKSALRNAQFSPYYPEEEAPLVKPISNTVVARLGAVYDHEDVLSLVQHYLSPEAAMMVWDNERESHLSLPEPLARKLQHKLRAEKLPGRSSLLH